MNSRIGLGRISGLRREVLASKSPNLGKVLASKSKKCTIRRYGARLAASGTTGGSLAGSMARGGSHEADDFSPYNYKTADGRDLN